MNERARIECQIDFLLAADRLKSITRQNRLHDGSRAENAAEHSWHLTLMALTFAQHASPGTDLCRVIELLVIHDLVEIRAGDHHRALKSADELVTIEAEEALAADHLFRALPEDQWRRFHALWQEFLAASTPEARFAHALDALHPLLMTWGPKGLGSAHHALTAEQVIQHKRPALSPFPGLWMLARETVERAVERGVLSAG